MLRKVISAFVLSISFFGSQIAYSDIVPVPANGSSVSFNGVTGFSSWANNFKILWNITQEGANYHYVYTISNETDGPLAKTLSHFILEVSPSINEQNFNSIIFKTDPNTTGPQLYTLDPNNPGMPASGIYGIKFEPFQSGEVAIIDFISTRAPIWGDFYAKGGKSGGADDLAYNSNFGLDPTFSTLNFNGWIPTPDTSDAVGLPEPSTYLILGGTMACLIYIKRRREKVEV